MENSFTNSGADPLLLLKERIIKTETLLDKYSCLTRKYNDLEKSHSEAIENEKKAKKDAIKYLEKYCKIVKKSNCLLIKIKTLEDNINAKSIELRDSKDEYAKLESLLEVYKTERKGHQHLKKDRDYLLLVLWRVLKKLEEDPTKDNKTKKITENFFKRFERELMDLKLEDFRYKKVKNVYKLAGKDESNFLFSPGSQVLSSIESDFIDTDISPESVKSSFEELDEDCALEEVKPADTNHCVVDTKHKNDIENVKVNSPKNQQLLLPDLSFESLPSQDLEETIDTNLQEKHMREDCVHADASKNNGFNLCHSEEQENCLTSVTSFNFPTEDGSIFDSEKQNEIQNKDESSRNYLNLKGKCSPLESKDDVKEEEEVTKQFRKTYYRKKFQTSSQNNELMNKNRFDNCPTASTDSSHHGSNVISNTVDNITSTDIDIFNDSSETIDLDSDVSVEDIGGIPDNIQYCDRICDFLASSGEIPDPKERAFDSQDSDLLFLAENELVDKVTEVNVDTKKSPIQKSSKTLSVFDVDDTGNSTSSKCFREKELSNICLEFNSDDGITTDLGEVNKVFEINEKNSLIEHHEVSRKLENETQVVEKSQKISNSSLKESNINFNSNQFDCNMLEEDLPNSELTEQECNISDEEIFRILNDYKLVPLLSPIKEKPTRREPFVQQSPKHDNCNDIQDIEVIRDEKMESCEDVLNNKPNNREEGALVFNPKTDKEGEKKMVDKFVQTDGKYFHEYQMEQQSNEESEKMVLPEAFMKKLCKMVWKRNWKKLKYLNNLGKMCEVHSSCMDIMKTLLEMVNHPGLYFRNRIENLNFRKTNMSQRKSNLKCDGERVFSWQLKDMEDANVISRNEPLVHYPKVEDCSFSTQIPIDHYSKDRLNNSTVKSEEIRSQKNKSSCNWPKSDQQTEFVTEKRRESDVCSNNCECNSCGKYKIDSDITLLHCHSNDAIDDFEKRCKSSAEARNTSEDVENSQKSNIESTPEIDIVDRNLEALETKADHLEKCIEVQKSQFQSGEACSEARESVIHKRRISRIRSGNTLLMEEKSHTNDHSLTRKESHDLMKFDSLEVSSPPTNSTFTECHETRSNKSVTDILSVNKISEESKSSSLKEKFEELFGCPESPSDCSSPETDEAPKNNLTHTEVQKEVSVNLTINTNTSSSATAASRKRRIFSDNSKARQSHNKRMNLALPSTSGSGKENFGERCRENEVPLNDTFSSEDISAGESNSILESIMSAMTKQTEYFKVQTTVKETEISVGKYQSICCAPLPSPTKVSIPSTSVHRKISKEFQMKGDKSSFLNMPYYWSVDNNFGNQTLKDKKGSNKPSGNRGEEAKLKSLVEKEISNFLKVDIKTVEEGEEKIKPCIKVLRKASENVIAKVMVNEIMANVDEELQEFERPAPPLTQTQHRIMIILTVFSLSDEQFHRISGRILKMICSKIFPENFFWPDDSLEMATRFYAALCKRLNNFKGIWKFCFTVLTSMRQRWSIPIFVVLQVWPDIIHNANKVQNNLMVKTFVNIILHSPKSEDMRRKRQEQKLLALKHLLINFYNFDMNSTIESFTQELWESLVNNTPGGVNALILLSKCRTWSWTRKNVIAKLLETLESWMNGKAPDIMVSKVLDILQQITVIFPDANAEEVSSAKDVTSALDRILISQKLNPTSEEKVIRILCSLSYYSDVKDILVRLLEKFSASDPLYADIQIALSSKAVRRQQGYKKANTKVVSMHKRKAKPKKKVKKKKKNSSLQKSVLDCK